SGAIKPKPLELLNHWTVPRTRSAIVGISPYPTSFHIGRAGRPLGGRAYARSRTKTPVGDARLCFTHESLAPASYNSYCSPALWGVQEMIWGGESRHCKPPWPSPPTPLPDAT